MSNTLPISSILLTDPMSKPARIQVNLESIEATEKPVSSAGTSFNIWYSKWTSSTSSTATGAKFKCNVKQDQGYTKARKNSYICLFFSRGCCYLGSKCHFYHRLPLESDNFNFKKDCFGRDKTPNYKDDMDGVGSYNHENHTLFIGNIKAKNIEEVLKKNFEQFGQIENIRVLLNKSCAFITYKLESEAQFAKEAMQQQVLDDGNETSPIIIRWSNEYKNQEKRKIDNTANAIRNMMDSDTHKKIKIIQDLNGKSPTEIVEVEDTNKLLGDDDEGGDVEKLIIKPRKEGKLQKTTYGSHNYTLHNGNFHSHSNRFRKPINGYANGNQREPIISDSTMKDVARFRKKLIFRRHEPKLVSVLGNYSTDEDDD
ncbi:unnamed protein product [Candida verbasci]|uniref:Pre-mRNA-splicing factor CWC2 n=1 Tax=Candida verbasci TaxID=1227364 RepID=A0A9W4X9Q4_9ASCO|nr:unnamed protein product [Candida verbasci]